MTIRVHGTRTCLRCKGICHEGSLRKIVIRGYGFRSHYFCSVDCMVNHRAEKAGVGVYDEVPEEVKRFIIDRELYGKYPNYEFVDCITR